MQTMRERVMPASPFRAIEQNAGRHWPSVPQQEETSQMKFVSAIALVASFLIASLFAAPGAVAQTPPAGESYTSPTYGYVIPLDDEWTIESTESENGTDVLRITNGEIVAFVTGFPADGTPEDCIQDMVAVIQERQGHDNFEFETPIESTGNTAFGV